MSSYLPSSELTALLPSDHGLSAGQLTTCIEAGSADVDSRLAHLYWVPFTDYVASPAASPPWIVRDCAGLFAACHAYRIMGALGYIEDDSRARQYYAHAVEVLQPFMDGMQQIAPETVYTTVINTSWGDGDPYSSSEAKLDITRGEYVEGSGRILTVGDAVTDYQIDEDFYITYHAPTRKWIVTRGDSTIGADATGHRVYYEVSRLKKREVVQTRIVSPEIWRG